MAKLKMKEVTDRLGVFLLPKERVIVVSAEQSGAVQFFLCIFSFAKQTVTGM